MLEYTPDRVIEYGNGLGDFSPLNLDDSVLENIYYKNQRALLGEPRAVDKERFRECAEILKAEYSAGAYDFLPEGEPFEEISHLDHMIVNI